MSEQKKVWVTGASGFIGRALVKALSEKDFNVVAVTRHQEVLFSDPRIESLVLGDLAEFDEADRLTDVDCVIHLAGLAHSKARENPQTESRFMRANRDSTQALATAASKAGVRRFVLMSSIHVLGNNSGAGVFNDDNPTRPHNAYARSKLAAEEVLKDIVGDTPLEYVILRPPLVYGAGVKGNLATLIAALQRRLPLPLGAIHNRRSLIGLGNMVDLMMRCIEAPAAAGQTFVASDREVVSTTVLIKGLAAAMGQRPLLIPVPASLLALLARCLGKAGSARQLLGNLEIDSSRLRAQLNWAPPFSFEQGLAFLKSSS